VATGSRLDEADRIGDRGYRCPADSSADGTDVNHATPPRSGASGDLPPWVGGQDVAAATTADHSTSTINPITTTVTKFPTLAGKIAAKPSGR